MGSRCPVRGLWVFILSLFWTACAWAQVPPAPAEPDDAQQEEIRVLGPNDEAIQARIASVLAAIDGLERVDIQVSAGVVTLSGRVPNPRAARAIIDVANRVEGVVYVQNRLEEEVALNVRLRPTTERFQEMGLAALRMLPLILVAMAALIVFALLGRWLGGREDWMRRLGFSDLSVNLGRRAVRLAFFGIGVLLALEILDATSLVGALIGVAGVAGIAVGFAFRNIAENYLAGILLSARNPFAIGDAIQIGDHTGQVVRLTSRDTVLMTLDGNHLRIPNSAIITSTLINFTRNPLRRFRFTLDLADTADLAAARQIGLDTLLAIPGVLQDPAPQGLVTDIEAGVVKLCFHVWINQRDTDMFKARSEAIRLTKAALTRAGATMPVATTIVRLRQEAAAQEGPDPADPGVAGSNTGTGDPRQQPTGGMATEKEIAGDVSSDHTIDHQVQQELQESGEENLLVREVDRTPGKTD